MSTSREPDSLAEPVVAVGGDLLAPPADVSPARLDVDDGEAAGEQSATERAKSASGDAAQTTADKARGVAGEAKAQVRSVVDETKGQVSGLLDQAKSELRTQAADRGFQAAGSLRTFSDRVGALASGRPEEAGPLTGYLEEAQNKVSAFAERLDQRGLEGALEDVGSFARRRPGLFLLGAVGAGFVVGRFVRSGASAAKTDSQASQSSIRTVEDDFAALPSAMPSDVLPPPSPLAP